MIKKSSIRDHEFLAALKRVLPKSALKYQRDSSSIVVMKVSKSGESALSSDNTDSEEVVERPEIVESIESIAEMIVVLLQKIVGSSILRGFLDFLPFALGVIIPHILTISSSSIAR